jgi:pSer/pThr/pTyr-binding forkhead associated (FHA) protein
MIDFFEQTRPQHILIIHNRGGQEQITLEEQVYSIGRHTTCDIFIDSTYISRHQATLFRCLNEAGTSYYRIVDGDSRLGHLSSNGMLINGQKTLKHNLEHGDMVIFSPNVYLTYECYHPDLEVSEQHNEMNKMISGL